MSGRTAWGRTGLRRPAGRSRGFTLIELLIVVSLIAIVSAVASLALRDPAATQLEREAARLTALLETARAEARAAGVAVLWVPSETGFRFVGLPSELALPSRWLAESGISAEVRTGRGLAQAAVLGPEPVIGAQRIVLRLEAQTVALATDGFGPFAVVGDEGAPNASR
jgi:general secretion pathway protein H